MKRLFSLLAAASIMTINVQALTLEEAVGEVLTTNPVVIERLKNYRKTVEDQKMAEAKYLPSLDWLSRVGYEDTYSNGDIEKDVGYYTYEHSLTLTQNLYNGFATKDRVNYQKARVFAAAHHYIEQANDVAFNLVKQYVTVLKHKALLETEEENVQITQDIYTKIQDVYDSGFGTLSDVKKVGSALQLAQFNMLTQKNNLMDAEYNLARILGRKVSYKELELPVFNTGLPADLDQATMYAVKNNPSIKVTEFNLNAARKLLKEAKTGYLPTLDLVLNHTISNDTDGVNGFGRESSAMLVLKYNLYAGGADTANIQKNRSLIHQEFEIQKDIKRQIIEGLQLSWSAYTMIEEQLKFLESYNEDSKNTLKLYREEFDNGQRTLLDLLTAQDDYITSEIKTITANYDWLFSKYRILDALGEMVNKVFNMGDKFYSPVNLGSKKTKVAVLDTPELNTDMDKDKIDDKYDLCGNSLKGAEVDEFGCAQKIEEESKVELVVAPKTFGSFKEQFLNSTTGKYTISLATYSDMKLAVEFINRHNLQDTTLMYRAPKGERIKVVYGVYDTKEDAAKALNALPTEVLVHKPYVDSLQKQRGFYNASMK